MNASEKILEIARGILTDTTAHIDKNLVLVGSQRAIKSRELVELCLALEEYAEELNFEFDWTSESAMSPTKSIFRTLGTLIESFEQQRNCP